MILAHHLLRLRILLLLQRLEELEMDPDEVVIAAEGSIRLRQRRIQA